VSEAGTVRGVAEPPGARFGSPEEVQERLRSAGYLADRPLAVTIYLADRLNKPVLCEGPAGVGKTELAKAVAEITGHPLIRLQCYEGLDEAKALYEWNYKKQLLRIQADADQVDWHQVEQDIFTEDFLLSRPLLTAISSSGPVVLLIDEIDRLEVETEALLLEVLSDWQVSIPELGTVRASNLPFAVLTSNNTRELSEALKRRCLFLPMTYPTVEREREIILARVPGIDARFAEQIARVVRTIRGFDLKKAPSVSETLDWTRTLLLLGQDRVDEGVAVETLPLLLKYQQDIDLVRTEFEGKKV
jgi:MoxR-like ATPase